MLLRSTCPTNQSTSGGLLLCTSVFLGRTQNYDLKPCILWESKIVDFAFANSEDVFLHDVPLLLK